MRAQAYAFFLLKRRVLYQDHVMRSRVWVHYTLMAGFFCLREQAEVTYTWRNVKEYIHIQDHRSDLKQFYTRWFTFVIHTSCSVHKFLMYTYVYILIYMYVYVFIYFQTYILPTAGIIIIFCSCEASLFFSLNAQIFTTPFNKGSLLCSGVVGTYVYYRSYKKQDVIFIVSNTKLNANKYKAHYFKAMTWV